MFDNLSDDAKKELFINSLNKGDVLLKDFEEAQHKKFFIIAGKSDNKLFICSVFINSSIHPSLNTKPKLLSLQIPINKEDNDFLRYNSFANCAYPIISDIQEIASKYLSNECKVIGTVTKNDLIKIQQALISSDLLSDEEIDMFFK
ncbi:hypothetical protein [Flavobacterium oreochromis]|uniref:hypothetical protein n=1 Tax=Flavobacterium oreochromis TaxID=2906078 RepID=UPI00385C16EB